MSSLRKFSEEEDNSFGIEPLSDGQGRMVDGIIQVNEEKGGFGSKMSNRG